MPLNNEDQNCCNICAGLAASHTKSINIVGSSGSLFRWYQAARSSCEAVQTLMRTSIAMTRQMPLKQRRGTLNAHTTNMDPNQPLPRRTQRLLFNVRRIFGWHCKPQLQLSPCVHAKVLFNPPTLWYRGYTVSRSFFLEIAHYPIILIGRVYPSPTPRRKPPLSESTGRPGAPRGAPWIDV